MENRVTKTQFLLVNAFLTTTKNIKKSQSNSYNFLLAENERIRQKKISTNNK